jgi:hypothetical protein
MALLSSIYHVLNLLAQTTALFFTYLLKRRTTNKAFKNQLVESGLSTDKAKELTKVYSSSFSLRKVIDLIRAGEPS